MPKNSTSKNIVIFPKCHLVFDNYFLNIYAFVWTKIKIVPDILQSVALSEIKETFNLLRDYSQLSSNQEGQSD